jgi:hypothetical protein
MPKLLFTFVISVAAIIHASPNAFAQDKADGKQVEEIKRTDPVPPATGKNLPEQAGTQEPSSKVQGTSKSTDTFVNGVLAIPGIAPESETAPAKFSERIAADDRLPIAAYRLRRLNDTDLREVAQQLAAPRRIAPAAGSDGGGDTAVVVGALVPANDLDSLTSVPEAVSAKFAELRGTGYRRAGGKTVLVDLDNMLVIGVLDN